MKKLGIKMLAIFIIGMILSNSMALAASTSGLKKQQSQNNEKINEAEANLKEVQAEKSETVKEVENLTNQIADYESQINTLDTQISDLKIKIDESQKKLDKAQEDYTKQEELLNARLVATYEAGETSYLDFILSSESITDLISNYFLVTEIATSDTELLEKIQKQKQEIEEAKKTLEESKRELDTSKASKQSVSTQLKTAKSEKNQQVEKLSQDERNIQAEIDDLEQANHAINQKIQAAIKQAQQQQQQQQQQNKPSGGNSAGGGSSSGGGQTGSSSSGFIYPVPSAYARITTGLYYSSGQYHGAVDFGTAGINGQPIYAVADGQVIISERLSGSYGNYIIIMHDNGLFTLYAHGQDGSRAVSAGQRVKQGQQIMRVGNTGNSSGPHLHFEVRVSPGNYNNRVDPRQYL